MATLSPPQIFAYARQAGFSVGEAVIMTAIAGPESGGRTDATHKNNNGSTDLGVWQINDDANADVLSMGDWRDPAINARMARVIYKRQGYSAWSVFKSGKYRDYLGDAMKASAGGGASILPPIIPDIPGAVGDTADAVKFITDPHTWLRVAMFGLGISLIAVALISIGYNVAPEPLKKAAKAAVTRKIKAGAK